MLTDIEGPDFRHVFIGTFLILLVMVIGIKESLPRFDCRKEVTDLNSGGKTYRTNHHSISHWGSRLSFQDAQTKTTVTLEAPYSVSECLKE